MVFLKKKGGRGNAYVKNLSVASPPDNYGPFSPLRLSISRSVVLFSPRRVAAFFRFPPERESACRRRPFSNSSFAFLKSSDLLRSFSPASPADRSPSRTIAGGRAFFSDQRPWGRVTKRSTRFSSPLPFPRQT